MKMNRNAIPNGIHKTAAKSLLMNPDYNNAARSLCVE